MAYNTYSIFLVQQFSGTGETQYIELDTEGINMNTIFSVSDVNDISTRKDTISQNIVFKGSKVNNQAFGNLFFLNRHADLAIENKILFNYSPLRKVDCLVYEDGVLLLNGTMVVTNWHVDKNKNVTYDATITGKFIDFKTVIADKFLTDLNLTDLKHHYTASAVTNSWNTSIERYSASTDTYYSDSFALGKGYIYPFIDYGVNFQSATANTTYNNVHFNNSRPAIYVKEYFDRIFANSSGYTYEVKGSSDFIAKFNSLIIPSTDEALTYTVPASATSITLNCFSGDTYRNGQLVSSVDLNTANANINFSNITKTGIDLDLLDFSYSHIQESGGYTVKNVFLTKKTFTAPIRVQIGAFSLKNNTGQQIVGELQLAIRDYQPLTGSTVQQMDGFVSVGSVPFTIPAASGSPMTFNFPAMTLDVGAKEYSANTQMMIRIHSTVSIPPPLPEVFTELNISWASVYLPYQTSLSYKVGYGDMVIPAAPANIKQLDFVKGVMNLFNLYVYNKKENPRHFIFEKYDDFYSLCQPQYLKNGLDWTNKIDYTNTLNGSTNFNLPKNYTFTYKDDADWVNAHYKTVFNETYGTFYFVDSNGYSSPKKIELPFSPTPMVQYSDTNRVHGAICLSQNDALTSLSLQTKKPVKSNMRILYYNGLLPCAKYTLSSDYLPSGGTYTTVGRYTGTTYANASNYYYSGSTPVDDLHFNYPNEFYFSVGNDYLSLPNSYTNYYSNQTTELTDANLYTVSCEAYLNENDIANLDLKQPVFIDMGELGHAYFKLLNVSYTNNKAISTVTLQKIGVVDNPLIEGGCTLAIEMNHINSTGTDGIASVDYSGNSGAVSFLWNNGSTSSIISGLTAGTYSVTVTDSAGCSVNGSVVVESVSVADVCIYITHSFMSGSLWFYATSTDVLDVDVTTHFTYSVDGGSPSSGNITILAGHTSGYLKVSGVSGTTALATILSFSPASSTYQNYVDCS